IAVAGPRADFAFTEVRIGVAPAVISLPLLPRLDPRAAARYCLTGESFGAAEAARIGLLTLAAGKAPQGEEGEEGGDGGDGEEVDALLRPVLDGLRKASPKALAATKALVTARVLEAFDRDAEDLVQRSATLFASAEAREGIAAFLERRDPAWVL
ncbi:enoyl-CoA hydratase-related protein, partial [Streptomyces clavuligerus]